MSGTSLGGEKAAQTIKFKYGDDFYHKAGRKGGLISRGGGFGDNRELAVEAGRKGGKGRLGKNYPQRIKLYELERNSKLKILAQRPDQDKPTEQMFLFRHLDGAYSYITPLEGEGVLHLSASTPLRRRQGYWTIIDE